MAMAKRPIDRDCHTRGLKDKSLPYILLHVYTGKNYTCVQVWKTGLATGQYRVFNGCDIVFLMDKYRVFNG
jgi:hypothetical protein